MGNMNYDPITGEPIDSMSQGNVPVNNMNNMPNPMNNKMGNVNKPGAFNNQIAAQNGPFKQQVPMGNMNQPAGNGTNNAPFKSPSAGNMNQPGGNGMNGAPNNFGALPQQNNKPGLSGKVIGIIVAAVLVFFLIVGVAAYFIFANKDNDDDASAAASSEVSIDESDEDASDEADEDASDEEDEDEDDDDDNTQGTGKSKNSAEALFTFSTDDHSYTLPAKVSDFIDDGWTFNKSSDATKLLGTNEKDYIYFNYIGDTSRALSITVVNYSMNATEIQDCYVCEFVLYDFDFEKLGVEASVHGGDVVLGESTMDDVKEFYGEPTSISESSSSTVLYYYKDGDDSNYYSSLRFGFEEGNDKLSYIGVKNDEAPEGMEDVEVSDEAPDYLSNYKAPSSLGNDFSSGNVEIEGVVYNVPVPMQVLTDNGWTYDEEDTFVVGAGQGYSVALEQDDKTIYVTCYNLSTSATYLKYTIVTSITYYPYSDNAVDFKLPGGLSGESTDEDVQKFLTDNGVKDYEYTNNLMLYNIPLDQSGNSNSYDEIEINFEEDGSMSSISISNYGWLNQD